MPGHALEQLVVELERVSARASPCSRSALDAHELQLMSCSSNCIVVGGGGGLAR